MKLKISVNKNCKNKENPDKVATGWLNIYEDIEWLDGWVKSGFGWCATHFVNRYRKSDNSSGSNLVVIDIDGDVTLEEFWSTQTAVDWCIATYTSASHTESEHRFRALFPLEIELDTIAKHKGAYWLVVNRLLGELNIDKLKDNCGQKPERLWYGNTNATFRHNEKHAPIPQFLLESIDYEEPTNFVHTEVSDTDIERCKWLLTSFLRPSEDDEYESYYVPVMAACAGIGQSIFDEWVQWVLKGHHGQKEDNIRPYKWKGLGNFAGHTSLYALAKKQDANWTRSLPTSLRFSFFNKAVGYDEVDPTIVYPPAKKPMNITPEIPELDPLPDTQISKKKGRPKKSVDDLAKERESDVGKVKNIFNNLRRNLLTNSMEFEDESGHTHELQGHDLEIMTTKLSCEHGVFIPEQRVKQAIQYAASKNTYCPIRQYLDKCRDHAVPHANWHRVGEIFLGNKDPLATLAIQRMMIGAVARAYNPGCTMSWLPILVGAQGCGKSQFCRSLVPSKLFAEITTPLETLMKEQYRLHIAWMLELPEIDNFFSRRNIENFKNLVTTRCDETRRPYASLPERLQRRFVMIGTTNRNQFLVDSTGNRRFVPLEVGSEGMFLINWKQLRDERDMLWASAIEDYQNNVPYEFSSGEIAKISEYIQQFGEPDPWSEKILNYVKHREEVSVSKVLTEALDLDARQQGIKESRRVTDVLQTLGWRRKTKREKDQVTGKWKSVRIWLRPENDPINEAHINNDF